MFTEQDYKDLDDYALLDLLADQTAKYTKALVQGAPGHNLNYYRTVINIISEEIRSRQIHKSNVETITRMYSNGVQEAGSHPSGNTG